MYVFLEHICGLSFDHWRVLCRNQCLRKNKRGVELLAENPEFATIVVGPGDAFALEGVAVGLIRNSLTG